MNHNCYVKRYPKSAPLIGSYDYLSTEQVESEGRVVSRSVFVADDPCTRNAGLKCSDFCLENQLAAGVDLKSCVIGTSDFVATSNVLMAFEGIKSMKEKFESSSNE